MANFSTNQVKQLYVGNNHVAVNMAVSTVGDLAIQYNSDEMWLQNFGYGGAVRSDLIKKANITSVTAKKATVQNYQRYVVALNSDGLSGGSPIVGTDYILRIAFRQFVGISEEDQYFKYGTVHVTTGMTASAFYIALAQSLFKNFSRDISKLVNIYMYDGTNYMQVTAATVNSITGSYTGVAIEEAPQDWILGVYKQYSVNYTVQPVSILNNSQEVIWGTITDTTSTNTNYYINGKVMADMEYFCMGERGDIYRNVGFPYILHTQYLIDSTKEYHSIDIAYFYQGKAEDIQKSPKTITILVPKGSTSETFYTTANLFLADIRTATGLTTTQLPVLA